MEAGQIQLHKDPTMIVFGANKKIANAECVKIARESSAGTSIAF